MVYEKCELELITVELTTKSRSKMCACCGYSPPNSNSSWLAILDSYLANLSSHNDNIVIYEKFNLPNISWDFPDHTVGADEIHLTELLNDYFLCQANNGATRCDSILDLVITSVPDQVNIHCILSPQECGIITDHNCIVFNSRATGKAPAKLNRHVILCCHADNTPKTSEGDKETRKFNGWVI